MSKSRRPVRNLLNRDGRYFARLVVPESLRGHVGKRELLKPLGGDRAEALRKLPGCIAEFQEVLARARKGENLPRPTVSAPYAARELYRSELEIDLLRRRLVARGYKEFATSHTDQTSTKYLENLLQIAHGPMSSSDYVDYDKTDRNEALNKLVDFVSSSAEDDEGQIEHLHKEMNANDTFIDANIGYAIDDACRGKSPPIRGAKDWEFLVREIAGAKAESMLRIRERDAGNFNGRSKYDDPPDEAEQSNAAPVTLSGLLEGYAVSLQRAGRGAEMRKKGAVSTKNFASFLGHEDPRRIKRSDIRGWIESLREELSEKTIRDSYVASLKAVLGYGLDEGLLTSNEASGIRLKIAKQRLPREKGYTRAEASQLLMTTLAYVPVTSGRESEKLSLAKRWVPLLCAYTGARVAEICQLRKCDVEVKDGTPCIRITPDAGGVKNGLFRDVPLHRDVIDRGFLNWVEGVSDGPLFFDARGDRRGTTHPSKFVAGRISDWLRATGLVPDSVSPSHGFRHAFKTLGMEAGIEIRYLDVIQGHAPRTAGEGYQHGTIPALLAAIEKFPSLVGRVSDQRL